MSQINYSILRELLKKNNHIRGLAKDIGTNQTTIARKVKELEEQNVVDFRIEGKNKVYFLKQSLEAEEQIKISEQKKLIEAITKYPRLRKIVEHIKKDKEIQLAIIFGSYTKTPSKNSDIDIYLETTNRDKKKEIEKLDSKASVKIGEFNKENLLIKEIIKNHVIIKGVERFYEHIH